MKLELLYAWRQLRRTPGYTLVVIATLSLGLASTVTMFAAVNAAFLRALPFPEEGRLVKVYQTSPQRAQIRVPLLVARDWSRDARDFTALAAYLSRGRINVAFDRRASRANLARVTRPFFDAVGVAPVRGRTFDDDETRPGGPAAVVISF